MKSIFTLLLILCFSVIGFSQNHLSNKEKKLKILEVAQNDLASFLENIPIGFEKQHGFNSRGEFNYAKPNSIYSIFGIDSDGKTFKTNLYNVSISVNGEYRSMITVSYENGDYSIETVGASMLAKELQVIENNSTESDDLEKIMLNFYDKKCGFVAYESDLLNIETANYLPLASATTAITANRAAIKSSYKLSEIKTILSNN